MNLTLDLECCVSPENVKDTNWQKGFADGLLGLEHVYPDTDSKQAKGKYNFGFLDGVRTGGKAREKLLRRMRELYR